MHKLTLGGPGVSQAEYKNHVAKYRLAENIKNHMTYICAIALYDKMGMSWKKLDNCYTKLFFLTTRWRDDSDEEVTSERLLNYSKKKGLDIYRAVLDMSRSDKMALADMKKGIIQAAGVCDSEILACLLLITPILKETYRFSNAKMNEFYKWVSYYITMYNTKLPKEKGNVFSDEYIRLIFIEDEGFDMKIGEYVKGGKK